MTSRAHQDWILIKGNIYASDYGDKKQEFIDYHDNRCLEFLDVVNPIYDKTYQVYCVDNTASEAPEHTDPFDGSAASSKSQTTNNHQGTPNKPSNSPKEASSDRMSNTYFHNYW